MECSEQSNQLLTLSQGTQLDCSRLELGAEHVDELIRMATDAELLNVEEDSNEFWATVHAWYALRHLKATEAGEC